LDSNQIQAEIEKNSRKNSFKRKMLQKLIINKIKFNKHKFNIKKAAFMYDLSWLLLRPFILFIFSPEYYKNKEIDELKKPFIIAANHKSYIDPWIISGGLSFKSKIFPIIWLADNRFFKIPIASFILKIYSALPIRTKIGFKRALKEAVHYLKEEKVSIGIFPEGKIIFNPDKIEIFKRGVGFLYKETNTPILPIAIRFRKKFEWLDLITRKNKVYVYFGRPIYNFNIQGEDLIKIPNYLRLEVKDLFNIYDYYSKIDDKELNLEKPSLLFRLLHSSLIFILNSKIFSFAVKKLTQEGKIVSQNPGSALSMEVVYTLGKKNIFSIKSFNDFAVFIFDRVLFQTKALRNRLKIVKKLLRESLLEMQSKEEIKILSLGGGSLRSILSAIAEINNPKLVNKIEIVSVDTDLSSVELVEKVKKEVGLENIKIKILNIDSLDFLKNIEKHGQQKFDLVEVIGLIDYLKEDIVINKLNLIYNIMKNKSFIIFSNIAPNNEAKFLENINWPHLYYRNVVDLVYILKKTTFKKASKIIEEPLSIHNIVYIKKQNEIN
jgi:1-acyl-sn-glycerol-3-phosphate acyltransferase